MKTADAARTSRSSPMPPDFPAFARMKTEALCERYRCGRYTITRWRKECGMGFAPIPAPDGFREIAPLHTLAELERIYGRSNSLVIRWAREAGVTLKREGPRRRACVKRDPAAEIALCLTCPFPQCRYGKCARIGS